MNGLGGLNKSENGVVIGLVQLQLPLVKTPEDLRAQTARIVDMVAKARRNMGTMDLVVFPEYALHGLSMDTNPEIMCRVDGPEVAAGHLPRLPERLHEREGRRLDEGGPGARDAEVEHGDPSRGH